MYLVTFVLLVFIILFMFNNEFKTLVQRSLGNLVNSKKEDFTLAPNSIYQCKPIKGSPDEKYNFYNNSNHSHLSTKDKDFLNKNYRESDVFKCNMQGSTDERYYQLSDGTDLYEIDPNRDKTCDWKQLTDGCLFPDYSYDNISNKCYPTNDESDLRVSRAYNVGDISQLDKPQMLSWLNNKYLDDLGYDHKMSDANSVYEYVKSCGYNLKTNDRDTQTIDNISKKPEDNIFRKIYKQDISKPGNFVARYKDPKTFNNNVYETVCKNYNLNYNNNVCVEDINNKLSNPRVDLSKRVIGDKVRVSIAGGNNRLISLKAFEVFSKKFNSEFETISLNKKTFNKSKIDSDVITKLNNQIIVNISPLPNTTDTYLGVDLGDKNFIDRIRLVYDNDSIIPFTVSILYNDIIVWSKTISERTSNQTIVIDVVEDGAKQVKDSLIAVPHDNTLPELALQAVEKVLQQVPIATSTPPPVKQQVPIATSTPPPVKQQVVPDAFSLHALAENLWFQVVRKNESLNVLDDKKWNKIGITNKESGIYISQFPDNFPKNMTKGDRIYFKIDCVGQVTNFGRTNNSRNAQLAVPKPATGGGIAFNIGINGQQLKSSVGSVKFIGQLINNKLYKSKYLGCFDSPNNKSIMSAVIRKGKSSSIEKRFCAEQKPDSYYALASGDFCLAPNEQQSENFEKNIEGVKSNTPCTLYCHNQNNKFEYCGGKDTPRIQKLQIYSNIEEPATISIKGNPTNNRFNRNNPNLFLLQDTDYVWAKQSDNPQDELYTGTWICYVEVA